MQSKAWNSSNNLSVTNAFFKKGAAFVFKSIFAKNCKLLPMKKVFALALTLIISLSIYAQNDPSWLAVSASKKGSIEVHYFDNYPFSYKNEFNEAAGIEIEILKEFSRWLEENKGVKLSLTFKHQPSFKKFYEAVKNVDNGLIGAGSASITEERKKEVGFSSAYMRNRSIFITRLEVPTIRTYKEVTSILDGKVGLVISSSIYENELMEIKKNYYPSMRVEFMDNQRDLLNEIEKDGNYFGMVDIISYWAFVQEKGGVLKAHRELSKATDYLGFLLPKNSDWHRPLNEFLEGGFGFIATKRYQDILTKYLGYEIMKSVELY